MLFQLPEISALYIKRSQMKKSFWWTSAHIIRFIDSFSHKKRGVFPPQCLLRKQHFHTELRNFHVLILCSPGKAYIHHIIPLLTNQTATIGRFTPP
ncbi:MAG: hypothetical protein UW41_C0012G0005 [Candidatus Collierbacteria bacterium GW2011_GWC2_44_18]|uniref:Uncharacterized protein n=1 Tax=Candidatus Collierbacteria bacterium GW2011_GWC2_44_18 TaxID=1618392 RepID=A0A0G1JYT7_9BACT|nr:MAG: hypothetical protein UW16_C0031G0013 [Microgenomates group bacterium GW2011_GWC1_44_10]KKT49067.1 MAG: hypothetical protein UW41_C0012G0005 [Candidatus Collierbacteria bacterium GW2011_GWC2_44_18]